MKKYSEIKTASEKYDEPLEPDTDDRDKLILELEAQGHKVIMVGRAALVVEQCEEGDAFPTRMSQNPLKMVVLRELIRGDKGLRVHFARQRSETAQR
jgi:hypothetical protein